MRLLGKYRNKSLLANSPFTRGHLTGDDLPQVDVVQDDGLVLLQTRPPQLLFWGHGCWLRAFAGSSKPHPALTPRAALLHADSNLITTASPDVFLLVRVPVAQLCKCGFHVSEQAALRVVY